jgi:hypothetical protein
MDYPLTPLHPLPSPLLRAFVSSRDQLPLLFLSPLFFVPSCLPKNGNEVGAAISRTICGCVLCRCKRSLFQLTQRVSLFPPPRSDLLIGNALPSAIGASSRCGVPLIPRLRRGATLYLAPTGLRWFLISSSGVARGCHEGPRWGTGTPPFPQQLSCKVRPNAYGSQLPFPFLGSSCDQLPLLFLSPLFFFVPSCLRVTNSPSSPPA